MIDVLVVEDDPSVRGLLDTMLSSEGYGVRTAGDGTAGLVMAALQRPDLIIVDVMMPDLGGIRVIEELRGTPDLADVPVVVVTGKVEALPGLRVQVGEDNVFLKPFAVEVLLARVAELTGGPVGSP